MFIEGKYEGEAKIEYTKENIICCLKHEGLSFSVPQALVLTLFLCRLSLNMLIKAFPHKCQVGLCTCMSHQITQHPCLQSDNAYSISVAQGFMNQFSLSIKRQRPWAGGILGDHSPFFAILGISSILGLLVSCIFIWVISIKSFLSLWE